MYPSAGHTKTVVLAASLILTLALYFALFFGFLNRDIVSNGTSPGAAPALTVHAVPAFCLQWRS